MIEVKVRMRELAPDDTFRGVESDPDTEYMVRSVDPEAPCVYTDTEPVYCAHLDVELVLVSPIHKVVERIVRALRHHPDIEHELRLRYSHVVVEHPSMGAYRNVTERWWDRYMD